MLGTTTSRVTEADWEAALEADAGAALMYADWLEEGEAWVPCPVCRDGKYCPRCSGEGCSVYSAMANGACYTEGGCPDCHGSGRVSNGYARRAAGRCGSATPPPAPPSMTPPVPTPETEMNDHLVKLFELAATSADRQTALSNMVADLADHLTVLARRVAAMQGAATAPPADPHEAQRQAARDSEIAFAEASIRRRYGDPPEDIARALARGNDAVRRANAATEALRGGADEPHHATR